ncbi:hypothetical protein BJ138DRAFT_1004877 [Hygrophoropsis aurantiaca]|uniref:Uncharacterized protein n=1 Tax=Hygrophoropsis aurantiaca TaxID=72124 RepID=A0ACB8AFA8_9AGAM|nr:hypothetical protein BJ138DRAFT_1004877 [Hygrophoropsis aurantiaca]
MENDPKPLQALLGGIGLALSIHSLLILNGTVLGVSGFVHRSARGDRAAITSVLAMVLGGVAASCLDNNQSDGLPSTGWRFLPASLPRIIFPGLLVGMGSKLANGCTSGHMIAGISRLSKRSFVATTIFFLAAIPTAKLIHGHSLHPYGSMDWTFDHKTIHATIVLRTLVIFWATYLISSHILKTRRSTRIYSSPSPTIQPQWWFQYFTNLLTSFAFAMSLHVGNMDDPRKVLSFLVMPPSDAFDPTVIYLAIGALPLLMSFSRYARPDKPLFTDRWAVSQDSKIDGQLLLGSTMFGVGWALGGICPGPNLVNLGRSLHSGVGITDNLVWLTSMIAGGFFV